MQSLIFTTAATAPLLCFSEQPEGNGASSSPSAKVVYTDRADIPEQYKWDFSVYFDGWESWTAALEETERLYNELAEYRGRLAEGPEVLLAALETSSKAGILSGKISGFAFKQLDLDQRNNELRERTGEARAMWARIGPKLSWYTPELLSIPEETMRKWIDSTPGLEPYRFGLLDAYRTRKHTLDTDGERLMSLHSPVRGLARSVHSTLTTADAKHPVITLADGSEVTVTRGYYRSALRVLTNPDDRSAVQDAHMESYLEKRNTFATIYEGTMQQGWAAAQARGYERTIAMKLNDDDIPVSLVEMLIDTARGAAGALQRYHRVRADVLGLKETYGWSDMFFPLISDDTYYAYDDVVPWVIDSVSVLGNEYHTKMAEQLAPGWVDVYETPGKRGGAYNSGRYDIGSFVLLNYQGTLDDVFTLAHEMGHSMHTRLSQEYQPYPTHRYTIFVAEIAAILNEKLLLKRLLDKWTDPVKRAALLELQLENIRGTFLLQTMMADYELRAHALLEGGAGITADSLLKLWREVVKTHYGDIIPDSDSYYYSWARIPHLFNSPFYVYQYATSFAAASAFMQRIEEDPAAIDNYLALLKAGGNDHPVAQLRKVGLDIQDPEVLGAVTKEFEKLLGLFEAELISMGHMN